MCIWTQVTVAQATVGGLEARTLLCLLKASVFGEQWAWWGNREAGELKASTK